MKLSEIFIISGRNIGAGPTEITDRWKHAKRYNDSKLHLVSRKGNVGFYKFRYDDATQYYVAMSEDKGRFEQRILGGIRTYIHRPNVCEVSTVQLKRTAQGFGVGLALYKAIILDDQKTLISDNEHTPGSIHVWTKLAQAPNIEVRAMSQDDIEKIEHGGSGIRTYDVDVVDGDLQSNVPIYRQVGARHHARYLFSQKHYVLVAYAK